MLPPLLVREIKFRFKDGIIVANPFFYQDVEQKPGAFFVFTFRIRIPLVYLNSSPEQRELKRGDLFIQFDDQFRI
jgi:hypothetical protein